MRKSGVAVTRSVCFDVPALPMSMNEWRRKHWSVRHQESKRWDALLRMAALRLGVTFTGPVRVRITFGVTTRRRFDPDNHAKNVLDAIVSAGLIEDDSAPNLVSLTLSARLADTPTTEIMIEQADAPAWGSAAAKKGRRTSAA